MRSPFIDGIAFATAKIPSRVNNLMPQKITFQSNAAASKRPMGTPKRSEALKPSETLDIAQSYRPAVARFAAVA